MPWWTRSRERDGRLRARVAACETLEGRVVLSVSPAPAGADLRPIDVVIARRQDRLAPLTAPPGQTLNPPAPPESRTLDARGRFAYKTLNRGVAMAEAAPVRNVGVSYARLTVAGDTRKVGAAYLDAAIKGNGRELNQLGSTRLVAKVGDDFTNLSRSAAVKRVGHAFSVFGQGVADQFNRLFGPRRDAPGPPHPLSPSPPPPARPRRAACVMTPVLKARADLALPAGTDSGNLRAHVLDAGRTDRRDRVSFHLAEPL